MLKGFTEQKELKDVTVTSEGALLVSMSDSSEEGGGSGIPIKDNSTTILSNVIEVSTTETQIPINQRVKSVMIANYSEEATIIINAGQEDLKVGPNIAIELPINYGVENLNVKATQEAVKIQITVKGDN